jgi:hypothetical protein
MSDAVETLREAAEMWPEGDAGREAIYEVLARLDKAECNEGCVGVEEYDRVLAENERLRKKVLRIKAFLGGFQAGTQKVYRETMEENEQLRAALDNAERRSGMLSSVHGALVDAGLRMGPVGECEADKVRELTARIEAALASLDFDLPKATSTDMLFMRRRIESAIETLRGGNDAE